VLPSCGSDEETTSSASAGSGGATSASTTTGAVTSATTGGPAGSGGGTSSGPGDGLRSGPFKMLVLDKTLEYHHDSIAAGQQMLTELGQTKDADLPEGAKPGSQFTVDIAKQDLTDFTAAKLANYEILFFMSPTGPVFSDGGAAGATGKVAIQGFMKNGGAWAG